MAWAFSESGGLGYQQLRPPKVSILRRQGKALSLSFGSHRVSCSLYFLLIEVVTGLVRFKGRGQGLLLLMGGAAKSVKRGLGTRRGITAASFADSCHSDERK